jgi:hypothetical protein
MKVIIFKGAAMSSLGSFCGIYCGACLCNIARDSGKVAEFAQLLNKSVEQLTCTECKTALHQDCCFVTCCTARGLDNCSECPEMPCADLLKFAKDGLKHHACTIPNLIRIREIGLEAWLEEQKKAYICHACGARTGWSFKTCLSCNNELNK